MPSTKVRASQIFDRPELSLFSSRLINYARPHSFGMSVACNLQTRRRLFYCKKCYETKIELRKEAIRVTVRASNLEPKQEDELECEAANYSTSKLKFAPCQSDLRSAKGLSG